MPQPDAQALIVRGPLANVSIMYNNRDYIQGGNRSNSERAFPIIPNVTNKSKILTYKKGAWFRNEAKPVGRGRSVRGGYPTGSVDIDPIEYGFAKEVYDKDRRIAKQAGSPPLNLDTNSINYVSDKIDLSKEARVAALVKATAWSGQSAGGEDAGGLWAAGSSNTFLVDIFARITTIHNNTGFFPNRLIIDSGTWLSLVLEETLLNRLQITKDKIITTGLLSSLFNMTTNNNFKVFIAGAITSTAKEAKDGDDFTSALIWENTATKGMGFLYYATETPALEQPNALYECRENLTNGMQRLTEKHRESVDHRDVYEVRESTDYVASGPDLGFMWKDTLLD